MQCNIFFYYSFLRNLSFHLRTLISLYFFSCFCLVFFFALNQVFIPFCQFSPPRQRFFAVSSSLAPFKFLQFYFPHVLAYFPYRSIAVQFLGSSFWSALSAVLFQFSCQSLRVIRSPLYSSFLWPKQCKCNSQSSFCSFVVSLF